MNNKYAIKSNYKDKSLTHYCFFIWFTVSISHFLLFPLLLFLHFLSLHVSISAVLAGSFWTYISLIEGVGGGGVGG